MVITTHYIIDYQLMSFDNLNMSRLNYKLAIYSIVNSYSIAIYTLSFKSKILKSMTWLHSMIIVCCN